jgi:serine/threonine protein kinase
MDSTCETQTYIHSARTESSQERSSKNDCCSSRSANSEVPYERTIDFIHLFGLVCKAFPQNGFCSLGNTSFAEEDFLGEGASFSVGVIKLIPSAREHLTELNGRNVRDRIVTKRLKYTTDKIQRKTRNKLLKEVLTEIRALTHKPLREHQNIATLLAVIWEPDPNHYDIAWPILMMEYAEEGTLLDYQKANPRMAFAEKILLCEDVAQGLQIIHDCGIIHGDLKSENVLTFRDTEKSRVVAKLGDFGCSITDYDSQEEMWLPAYTVPWNAPEYREKLKREDMKYTDVYSFGLLVLRTMIDGINPFKVEPFKQEDMDITDRAQQLKNDPEFLSLARRMMRERCSEDVRVEDVYKMLQLTLNRDPRERSLEATILIIRDITQNNDPICEGYHLEDFEYDDVCFHYSISSKKRHG